MRKKVPVFIDFVAVDKGTHVWVTAVERTRNMRKPLGKFILDLTKDTEGREDDVQEFLSSLTAPGGRLAD